MCVCGGGVERKGKGGMSECVCVWGGGMEREGKGGMSVCVCVGGGWKGKVKGE